MKNNIPGTKGFISKLPLYISVLTILSACGITGISSGGKVVPIKGVDQHGISLNSAQSLHKGDEEDTVVAVFGEPADKQKSCVLNGVVWRYPIRAWNDIANSRKIVSAIRLRVRFNEFGTLLDWGFIDARAENALMVGEKVEDAYRWFQSLSQAPTPIPPLIDLNKTLIRGKTTQQEVEEVLGQWRPDIYCGNGGPVPVVNKITSESGTVLDWYVDRPSPLFIPPYYLIVSYDKQGILIGWHLEATYPGGRK